MHIFKDLNNLSDEYIVVGVSAGPDSMALLHMLMHNTSKKIICAHVNHNIRKESNEEQSFIKKYCKDNNIICETMIITEYHEKNFENEARKKRYAFYEKVMKKYHSHTLLLAHHGDDLIETIIMKIIRGSNLEGYAGIKMYSKQKDYTIIRPLLNLTKEDILKYNKDNNLKYYIDKSNYNQNFTRNRIRLNILPKLKAEDKNIHLKFLKYSETLQAYYNYIEELTKEKVMNIYKDYYIDIELLKKEHPFIQKNIIFYILSDLYNNNANIIKDRHIDDIIKLINSDKPNLDINLPKNYIAKKTYNKLSFEKKKTKKDQYLIELKDTVKIDNIVIKKVDKEDTNGNNVCRLNSKDIKLPLFLRNKKNGDHVYLYKTNGKQKVKDVFINKKLPLSIRDYYPLLVDADDNILWIPNIKKTKYNVKKDEFYDIILTSYEESEEHNEKETK